MLLTEANEVRHACHGPVIIHDLADHSGGLQSCESCQIDGGFGLAASLEYAPVACTEWKDMARTRKVFSTTVGINCGSDCFRTIVS